MLIKIDTFNPVDQKLLPMAVEALSIAYIRPIDPDADIFRVKLSTDDTFVVKMNDAEFTALHEATSLIALDVVNQDTSEIESWLVSALHVKMMSPVAPTHTAIAIGFDDNILVKHAFDVAFDMIVEARGDNIIGV